MTRGHIAIAESSSDVASSDNGSKSSLGGIGRLTC